MRLSQPSGRSRSIFLFAGIMLASFITGCGEQQQGETQVTAEPAAEVSAAAILAAHEHESLDETCFMCDPEKRDKGRLWCKEHVRYEDRCWLCHPDLEDKDRLYCKEHFLYEDECFLCHPELKEDAAEPTADEPADATEGGEQVNASGASGHVTHAGSGGLFCNEHAVYEIECGICQPDLASSLKPGGSLKIRLPSVASADKAGIRTGLPRAAESTPGIEALCEVQYNLNALARVTPLAGGVIRSVQHDVGDQVAAGDVLVELHSAQAASAKSEYLSALVERDIRRQSFERETRLREQNVAAEKDYLQAQAALRASELAATNLRQQLINLGFTDGEVKQIESNQDASARLVVRAPFDGTIVERSAVVGEAVALGQPMFTVADLSSRWLVLSIPSRHITHLKAGQAVEARFDDLPGVSVHGQVTWIDSSVDPHSRMIKARALVTEDVNQIKTGLFGKARVVTGDATPANLVPRDAVQRHEGGTYVFVQEEADLFSIRRVALGQRSSQTVEVLAGLSSSDSVVTDGSFIVMSEFLKSRLGAGCADH